MDYNRAERHYLINRLLYFFETGAFFDIDLIFHMPEKRFLWGIIPTVSSATH